MIFVYICIYYYDLKNRCKIMLIIIIITSHSYIAKAQAKYLKKCKNELKTDKVIVFGRFR